MHTRHGAELLGGGERVHVIPHGAFEHLTRLPRRAPAAGGPRRRGGPGGALLRRGPRVQGGGRPRGGHALGGGGRAVGGGPAARGVDGAPPPARPARAGALRGALRRRPRAAGVLPARRPARASAPQRRRVGSAVRRVWLSASRWCSATSAAFSELAEEHGAGRLVPPGDPDALAAAIGELLDDPAERERLAARARAAAAGPYSWERIAERTSPSIGSCSHEGDLPRQAQALRRTCARLARRAGLRDRRRGRGRAGPVHPPRAAPGSHGGAPRFALRSDEELYGEPARRTWTS